MDRKIVVFSFLVVIGLLIFNNAGAEELKDPLGGRSIDVVIGDISAGIRNIVGTLAGIMFIVSGITFLVSGGNPELVQKAKSYLLYAVIGAIIALAAQVVATTAETAAKAGTFEQILQKIAEIVGGVVGSVAAIMFVISGIMFVVSGGSPERIQKAKSCLLYAVIGAVIAGLATIIAAIITGIFGTTGTG